MPILVRVRSHQSWLLLQLVLLLRAGRLNRPELASRSPLVGPLADGTTSARHRRPCALHQPHSVVPRTEATSASSPEPAAASFEALDIEEGPYFMISEVIGIIESRLSDIGTDLLYGAKTCAEKAKEVLSAGVKARDVQMCEAASAPLAVATAVLEASLEADDDVALWGALRLLKLAHDTLDEAVAQGVAA